MGAVSWSVGTILLALLVILMLAGCAPAHLTQAKQDVDARYSYVHRYSSVTAELARPEDGTANCTKYALEYQKAAGGKLKVCKTPSGQMHRVTVIGDWVLDNRYTYVMKTSESDCK